MFPDVGRCTMYSDLSTVPRAIKDSDKWCSGKGPLAELKSTKAWGVKCFCGIYIYQTEQPAKECPHWAVAELGPRRSELKALAG